MGRPIMILNFLMHNIEKFHCMNRVGGFDEKGKGTPEDLIFFYRHLDLNGRIFRVDEVLLVYRYHPLQTTFSIDQSVQHSAARCLIR